MDIRSDARERTESIDEGPAIARERVSPWERGDGNPGTIVYLESENKTRNCVQNNFKS